MPDTERLRSCALAFSLVTSWAAASVKLPMLRASSILEAGSAESSDFSLFKSETSSSFSLDLPDWTLAMAASIFESVSFITFPPISGLLRSSKTTKYAPACQSRFAAARVYANLMIMATGKAEIVCTGSELLAGKLNLYAPLFHERLTRLGFSLAREQSSGDDLGTIADCIKGALRRADLVIVVGGLGPTFDDLTRQAAAAALGRKLVYSAPCARILEINYGLKHLPPGFKNQCLLLTGAKPLENSNGTAFGQVITKGRKMLVLLPGPRKEWEPMFPDFLNAEISAFFAFSPISQVKLRLAGLWETRAEKLFRPVMRRFRGVSYTILAGPGTVDFILSGDDSRELVTKAAAACRKIAGAKIYGEGDFTLAGAVGEKLKVRGASLAAAESCTGGLAAQLITDIPGCSAWFLGGAVAYSNAAKIKLLGVKPATIKKYGAVSAQCAWEMAAGAKKNLNSDYAFSVTGIAGPDGGTPGKPVGLVYFGLAGPAGVKVFRRRLRGTRSFIRACAANFILDELRKVIK